MLFREEASTTIAITQPAHAWISGQIARAWGNDIFGTIGPYEDVCLAAEQHDMGWLLWEQAPTLNTATGRPHDFRQMDLTTHTGIWAGGTAMALALGRYPALLVSLHGTGLYARFDFGKARPDDAAVVRTFLDGQEAIQRRLIASLRADPAYARHADPATIERNRGIVRSADRMSLAICTLLRDLAVRTDDPGLGLVRQVPTAHSAVDIEMRSVPGAIALKPWPFAARTVHVSCEGLILPQGRFADQTGLRDALRDAERTTVTAVLTPG